MQFFVTSMELCVLGFQLVYNEFFLKKITLAFFVACVIIELLFYAYGGQMIKEKSSSVADRLYSTNNDLVLIIARSQKAAIIESGFYRANTETFATIVNSTASLIAVLKTFV